MADVFHSNFGELTEAQKARVKEIKEKATELYNLMNLETDSFPNADKRCMAVAKTELETSVMWAVKGVTT